MDVFFVLSGFLITTLILREKERTGRLSLRGFYTRRFFRIVPVYLFTVLLYSVAAWVAHDAAKRAQFKMALPWLLTFMQEFRPESAGNLFGHAWTLGIEEKFYLFWPLLVLLWFPFRGRAALWPLLLFAAVLTTPLMFARSYGDILIGAIVAIGLSVSAQWTLRRHVERVPEGLLLLLLAGSYLLVDWNNLFLLVFSTLVALVIASLVLRTGRLRALLENRVLRFIGRRSYGMYLVHVLVLNIVERALLRFMVPSWLEMTSAVCVVCVLGASIMHVAIERPCNAIGHRLSNRFTKSQWQQSVAG